MDPIETAFRRVETLLDGLLEQAGEQLRSAGLQMEDHSCGPQLSQPDRSWPSRSCSRARQIVLVMQSTEYWVGLNQTKIIEPMPQLRQRHGRIRGRIGDTWTQS